MLQSQSIPGVGLAFDAPRFRPSGKCRRKDLREAGARVSTNVFVRDLDFLFRMRMMQDGWCSARGSPDQEANHLSRIRGPTLYSENGVGIGSLWQVVHQESNILDLNCR